MTATLDTNRTAPTLATTFEALGDVAECLIAWERFDDVGTNIVGERKWVGTFVARGKRDLDDFDDLPTSVLAAPFEDLYARALQMRVAVETAPRRSASRAWNTFLDLSTWLALGKGETADLLGVGRTTPNAWEKGREPQPARARSLYRTHAFVGTLVRRMGAEQARFWLQGGEPSYLDRIRAGALEEVELAADHLIFGREANERIAAWTEDADVPRPAPRVEQRAPLRRVPRKRPKRAS